MFAKKSETFLTLKSPFHLGLSEAERQFKPGQDQEVEEFNETKWESIQPAFLHSQIRA